MLAVRIANRSLAPFVKRPHEQIALACFVRKLLCVLAYPPERGGGDVRDNLAVNCADPRARIVSGGQRGKELYRRVLPQPAPVPQTALRQLSVTTRRVPPERRHVVKEVFVGRCPLESDGRNLGELRTV